MFSFFTKLQQPAISHLPAIRDTEGVPRKSKKGFQPIKYFPRCKNCLDLYPGRQEQGWNYTIQDRSHALVVKAVHQSSRAGCAGCAVLEAILTPYKDNLRDDSQIRLSHLPKGRALVVRVDGGGISAIDLDVYTSPSWTRRCPWSTIAACTHVSGHTGSDMAVVRVRGWLEHCLRYHEECSKSSQTYLPMRVLEITGPQSMRLRVTDKLPGRYACLSHCWGSTTLIQTTTSNISAFQTKIPWSELPRSFQEAISFTYRLGLSYIWIDSLCIIQDDINDWRHEGSKMADIYQNSYITLATSTLSDSSGSCFVKSPAGSLSSIFTFTRRDSDGGKYDIRLRKSSDMNEPPESTDKRGTLLPVSGWTTLQDPLKSEYEICVRSPMDHRPSSPGAENEHLPLLTRGWFFQERLLSPRVVHFADKELYWECKKQITCECSELRTEFPRTKLDLAAVHPRIRWHRIVEEYTMKALTFPSDIFPALQGLAKQMQSEIDSEYYAGLWKDSLLRDLLWYSRTPAQRLNKWRAPTWSWASVMGPVQWMDSRIDSSKLFWRRSATIEAVATEAVGEDPMGELRSGYLRVRGQCIAASLLHDATNTDPSSCWRISIIGQDWASYLEKSGRFYPDYCFESLGPHCISDDTLVRIMRIVETGTGTKRTRQVCLVLRCVDSKEEKYERIGYVQTSVSIYVNQKDVFDHVGKEMVLTIV